MTPHLGDWKDLAKFSLTPRKGSTAVTPWSTVDVHARRDSRPSAAARDDPHSDVNADVEWQTPSLTITAKSSRCPAGGREAM